jgi:formylglycine-generating enzyme required for sulfatase activity
MKQDKLSSAAPWAYLSLRRVRHFSGTLMQATQQQPTFSNHPGLPESWATEWGKDRFGAFARLHVGGVWQTFRWIMPGTFLMGSPDSEYARNADETLHAVTLTQGFWLADTPVTQALWGAVMGNNPSRFNGAERPVENIGWDDAHAFIHQANRLQPGLALCLPTEAQWEYACRAGTTTPFAFGNSLSTTTANYHGDYPYQSIRPRLGKYRRKTTVVLEFPPNAWGLYGMHGNVWEWCQDWFGSYETKRGWQPLANPQGPASGPYRVLRGGSWCNSAADCRSACRDPVFPDFGVGDFGFRLACCPGQQAEP